MYTRLKIALLVITSNNARYIRAAVGGNASYVLL
jgi:hypothetical protein